MQNFLTLQSRYVAEAGFNLANSDGKPYYPYRNSTEGGVDYSDVENVFLYSDTSINRRSYGFRIDYGSIYSTFLRIDDLHLSVESVESITPITDPNDGAIDSNRTINSSSLTELTSTLVSSFRHSLNYKGFNLPNGFTRTIHDVVGFYRNELHNFRPDTNLQGINLAFDCGFFESMEEFVLNNNTVVNRNSNYIFNQSSELRLEEGLKKIINDAIAFENEGDNFIYNVELDNYLSQETKDNINNDSNGFDFFTETPTSSDFDYVLKYSPQACNSSRILTVELDNTYENNGNSYSLDYMIYLYLPNTIDMNIPQELEILNIDLKSNANSLIAFSSISNSPAVSCDVTLRYENNDVIAENATLELRIISDEFDTRNTSLNTLFGEESILENSNITALSRQETLEELKLRIFGNNNSGCILTSENADLEALGIIENQNQGDGSSADCYTDVCIPQIPEPLSCTTKYQEYQSFMQNRFGSSTVANSISILENEIVSEFEFCNNKLTYLVDDYINYISQLNIRANYQNADAEVVSGFSHPNYLSIGEFGATPFNYGYDGISGYIDQFRNLVNSEIATNPDESTTKWQTFMQDQYALLVSNNSEELCNIPNAYLVPTNSIEVPELQQTYCEQFRTSVTGSYQRDNLEQFLNRKREEFIQGYLKQATDLVVENFDMTYADKEYQYTLYYYDQAGNLIQTVPPEGIDRFTNEEIDAGISNQINQYRATNPNTPNAALLPNHTMETQYRYNSLNQLVWQQTPDGGQTRFAYDDLGRIIASQNAKQRLDQVNDARCEIEEITEVVTPSQIAYNNTAIVDGVLNAIVNPTEVNDAVTIAKLNTVSLGTDSYLQFSVDRGYRTTIEEEVTQTIIDTIQTEVTDNKGNVTIETSNVSRDTVFTVRRIIVPQLTHVGLSYGALPTNITTNDQVVNAFDFSVRTTTGTHRLEVGNNAFFLGENDGDDVIRIERNENKIYFYVNGDIRSVQDDLQNQDLYVSFLYVEGKNAYRDIVVGNYDGDANCETSDMSYTVYDALGRIIEAGEMTPSFDITITEGTGRLAYDFERRTVNTLEDTRLVDTRLEDTFPRNISDQQREVTRTVYNDGVPSAELIFNEYDPEVYANNIRNRVSAIYYFNEQNKSTVTSQYQNAIYYSYDIHGNVQEIVCHNKLLSLDDIENFYTGLKHVNYEYDLISGNVNKVIFQKGKLDQFIHQYSYDADNRITQVQTSKDGINWQTDAAYEYYAHGPMARVLIGDQKVQAMDYAYTIQGWLKGVNSETAGSQDIGQDGTSNEVAKDAFAYSLNYYNGDYQPIAGTNACLLYTSPSPRD